MKKLFALLTFLLLSFSFLWNCSPHQPEQGSNKMTSTQIDTSGTNSTLEKRVEELEQKGTPYEEFFNQLEGMTSTFSTFFAMLSIFLGFISVVMLVIQIWATRRDSKVIDEMRTSYRESNKVYEENNKNLLNAVIENITKTTSFIGSYEQLINLKETAEAIRKKEEEEEARRKEIQKSMNGKAMRLVKTAFEANFGSSFFSEYDRENFRSFFVDVSAQLAKMADNKATEQNWNADVYFLIGLNQFLSGQSKDAHDFFEKAASKIESYILQSNPENTDILFPEKECLKDFDGVGGWNKMLRSKCAFYTGLNYYRLGNFKLAAPEFKKAYDDFPNEIDPRFSYFQSQYWDDKLEDFPQAMHEMASLAEIIQSDTRKDEKTKKMMLARLYKKIGDFYLPSEKDDRYADEKDLNKTLEWYEKAYGLVQEVNGDLQKVPQGYTQFVPMVYFALGKALKSAGKSKPKSPESLFKETETLCEQVIPDIQNPETRYILYYTLAYCQHQLGEHREAGFSIANALVELNRFCSNPNYRGYSPINNIMLSAQHLRKELNTFKLEIFKRT